MTSWIGKENVVDTEPIRFEGDDNAEAWPEGTYVHIKARPNSGDARFLAQRLYTKRDKPDGKTELDYLWYEAELVACALFITEVEGSALCYEPEEDAKPNTPLKPLDFSGDFDARLKSAELLPVPVRSFIAAEIEKRTADPLARKVSESAGPSKPKATSRSAKAHLKLAN